MDRYKRELKSNNIDDTLDIDQYLTDKKRKRTNVMQIMQKEKEKKDQAKRGNRTKKGGKKPGKRSRSTNRRRR